MPIFEYSCEGCGHRFDVFFRRAEDADEQAPCCGECGSRKVRKLFSTIGLARPEGVSGDLLSGGCSTRST